MTPPTASRLLRRLAEASFEMQNSTSPENREKFHETVTWEPKHGPATHYEFWEDETYVQLVTTAIQEEAFEVGYWLALRVPLNEQETSWSVGASVVATIPTNKEKRNTVNHWFSRDRETEDVEIFLQMFDEALAELKHLMNSYSVMQWLDSTFSPEGLEK